MTQFPCLIRSSTAGGEVRFVLGDPLVDSYLAFVAGRSRPNTLRAAAPALGRSGSLDGFGQGTDHLVVAVGGAMEHVQTDSPPRQAHP